MCGSPPRIILYHTMIFLSNTFFIKRMVFACEAVPVWNTGQTNLCDFRIWSFSSRSPCPTSAVTVLSILTNPPAGDTQHNVTKGTALREHARRAHVLTCLPHSAPCGRQVMSHFLKTRLQAIATKCYHFTHSFFLSGHLLLSLVSNIPHVSFT